MLVGAKSPVPVAGEPPTSTAARAGSRVPEITIVSPPAVEPAAGAIWVMPNNGVPPTSVTGGGDGALGARGGGATGLVPAGGCGTAGAVPPPGAVPPAGGWAVAPGAGCWFTGCWLL